MRNMNMLDLNLLRVFEALMREQNVSLAAERLNLTQPAVSNALNRLRAVFEDQLFVRTRNGMEPTPVALALYEPIQQGLTSIRSALSEGLAFDPATSQRNFTIITTDVGELTYVAQLLRMLSREAPHIDLEVMEASREEYEKLLDSGKADFALGRFKISDSFRCELIGSCIYVAVMCSTYARKLGIKKGSVIPYDTFLGLAHVDVMPRGATANPIAPALGRDAARRRIALTIPHTSVLSGLLPDTELVATVPQPAVSSLCRSGALTWAYLSFETEITQLFMGWHKRQDSDKGHVWIREKLRAIQVNE
ncbi:DNA-binding transcriptional LysR family regulator [Beijerinckia sp. GAS462]|nr:DNA-binding transcriptional LysR family regulator [Beijerinckia sp. GAS462]SED00382.1 transcriptional regulator, LysR family [Beijerinckia sp. 28-YEA-48]